MKDASSRLTDVRIETFRTTAGFFVDRDLISKSHQFEVNGNRSYVNNPSFDELKNEQAGLATRFGRDKEPNGFCIDKMTTGVIFGVSEDVRAAFEIGDHADFVSLTEKRFKRASDAVFPHWARAVYASTGHLVLPKSDSPGSVKGGDEILDMEGNFLARMPYEIVFQQQKYMQAAEWDAIQSFLDAHPVIPLWHDYIYDARRSVYRNAPGKAIISAAIAVETIIRAFFWMRTGNVTHPTAQRIIDNVSIQGVLNKWQELTGLSKGQVDSWGKSSVHTLLEQRNALMHRGILPDWDLAPTAKLIGEVERFIRETDAFMRAESSPSQTRNPDDLD